MCEWTTARLGPLCEKIGSGATPRGGKESYKDAGISLIRSQNVYNNRFETAGLAFIDDEQAEGLSNVEVEPCDVLLNITGDSVARACQVPDVVLPARVNQHVAIIRPDPDRLDPSFLRYWFVNPRTQAHMLTLASAGATRKALTKRMIEDFEIPLPEIQTQRSIAHILGTLDDKIELNRRMNRTLGAIARAIFKSWFVDFDPVHAKAEGREPVGMDSEPAALFPDSFQDSPLGKIPKGWEVLDLGKCAEILDKKRIPLNSRERTLRQGPFPYYGAAGVMDHVDDYLFDGVHLLVGEDGSVATGSGRPVLQYVWGRFWVNNHAHVLVGRDLVSTEFLFLALDRTHILPYVTGAVQPKLNQGNLKRIRLVVPEETIRARFDSAIAGCFETRRLLHDQNAQLGQTRDALLPVLLRGDLTPEVAQ